MRPTMILSGGVLLLAAVWTMSCRGADTSPRETSTRNGDAATQTSSPAPVSETTPQSNAPCPPPPPDPARKITIGVPCDGATVAPREFVGGTVSNPNARVWVVIHPMEVADYWVQPNVTVRTGGVWKVLCYFGEPGPQHSGKHFEVIAFTNPVDSLKEGQLLPDWPQAESRSQVIEVVRE